MTDQGARPRSFGSVFPEESSASTPPSSSDNMSSDSTPASTSLPETCTEIVADGDMILELSPTDRFRVYSQVLCSASAVFNRMLSSGSNFSEAVALRSRAPSDGPVFLSLEDDDPAVLLIILRALHSQIKLVPRSLPLVSIVQAAVICDKYLLQEALQPIVRVWTDGTLIKSTIASCPEKWLLITWVFGPEKLFRDVSKSLIIGASVDIQKGIVIGPDRRELPEALPTAIIERIKSSRELCINAIRDEFHSLERRYLHEDVCTSKLKQCDFMQLGLLYRNLLVNSETLWSGSVTAIAEAVYNVTNLDYGNGKQSSSSNSFSKAYCSYCGSKSTTCCTSYNARHCPFCGTPIGPSSGNVHNCTAIKTEGVGVQDSHAQCSWLPQLKTKIKDLSEGFEGLTFSDFPSRTWAWM
ncbi:hypothetical protein FN846DRAFT_1025010 [Sphaerosporella brunnea]|uniref:BTB domain-containing protein n=1 Tax=Sphaerosporella brunnea TaxID=1250544 RepID=A0A5J5EGZ1_9PEZI|nr:hypothetical protein FN846DRAFT_1025010 [Sphaerosporella brunnea]